ncbi:MAG: DUF3034 family protein [Candidatus Omnitrophica bacterium]|nr:DUF3034 family protein [Candidatus Omnitrophota bacterium]
MKKFTVTALVVFGLLISGIAYAGAPFNNLEGVGGVAYNPLAYLGGSKSSDQDRAGLEKTGFGTITKYIGKPQFGTWYVNLSDVGVNWYTIGVSDTIADRLEVSYGFENINQKDAKSHNKNNIGAKFLVVPENLNDLQFIPAISVGAIYKNTDNVLNVGGKTLNNGWDGYLVASKTITQLPVPVIISGGVLLTNSYATGVFGYDKQSKATGFANIDVVLPGNLVAGYEYKQGPDFNNFKNADYWDIHVAWLANKNLSLVAAYTYAGDYKSAKEVGLGNGFVISAHYAF